MKETILKKAGELFLKLGFKSVTMDDIANDLGISKKTIYKFFSNKGALVDEAVGFMHEIMHQSFENICSFNYNAIEENYEIKKVVRNMMKNSDISPMFQLQKYYPKTYKKITKNQFSMFKNCILDNIEKGVSEGLYRNNFDKELAVKFYFALIMSIHDDSLYTYNKNTIAKLELDVLEYHIRAIATEKGLKILEEQIENNKL